MVVIETNNTGNGEIIMLAKVRNWYTTYQLKRKQSQLKQIDKWCKYITDSLVERQNYADMGIPTGKIYSDLDNTLGQGLGICVRMYHGVYANPIVIQEHAEKLLRKCVEDAESILGKELDKELKDF